MSIEIKHLQSLRFIKETGSITLAAKKLFLTQSAISHQLRYLEDYLATKLFERNTTPIKFTPAGLRLLQLSYSVLPLIENAKKDIYEIREGEIGELRIAVECHTCFDWLMPAMDKFRLVCPKIELDIVSGFQTDPVGLLLTHQADITIVSEKEENKDIEYKFLFSYEILTIISKNNKLAIKQNLHAEDFRDDTLITYPVSDDMLDLLKYVLIPAKIYPKRRYSELTIAIIQLVASNRGIAALPYWTISSYLEKGYVVARKIGSKGLYSNLYAAYRKKDKDKKYLLDFCNIIIEKSFSELPGISTEDLD